MPRLLFAWVVWLSLTTTSVNVVSAFLPEHSPLVRPQHTPFLVTQVVADDSPLGEDVAVPGKGERNVWGLEQQSRHLLAAVPARDLVSLFSQRAHVRRPAPAPMLLPVRAWYPRKLSPPSASDEPFLS